MRREKALKRLRRLLFVLFVILFLLFVALFTSCSKDIFQEEKKEEERVLTIFYESSLGSYQIEIREEKISVQGEEIEYCIQDPCPRLPVEHTLTFSEEKEKMVREWIEDMFSKETGNTITLDEKMVSEEDVQILNAIVLNEETLLEKKEKELLFSVSLNALNCPTVVLKLYDNHTYEYVYGIDENTLKEIFLTGKYTYPLERLFSSQESLDTTISYQIVFPTGQMTLLYNNPDWETFLGEIQKDLNQCMKSI